MCFSNDNEQAVTGETQAFANNADNPVLRAKIAAQFAVGDTVTGKDRDGNEHTGEVRYTDVEHPTEYLGLNPWNVVWLRDDTVVLKPEEPSSAN